MPPRKRTPAASSSRRSQSPSASVASEDPSEVSHTSRASRASARKPRTPRATAASARQRASGSASAVSAAAAAASEKPKTPRSTRTTRARSRSRTPAKRSPSPEREASTTPTPTTPSSRKSRPTRTTAADKAAEASSERVPPLPTERNPVLPAGPVPVKLQVIQREVVSPQGISELKEIVIGRIKLPTVNGPTHGFLLKRFDTNALAASSMFKIAFPYATPAAEQLEMSRLLLSYECHAANGGRVEETDPAHGKRHILPPGSSGVMLQGVWIPSQDAQALAEEYSLAPYTLALVKARAAVIDGKPYFLDDDGRPFANASGSKLDSKDRAFLWTNLETGREARKLKAHGLVSQDTTFEEAPEEPQEEEVGAVPTVKRSRSRNDARTDQDEEHKLAAEPEEALRAAREEAKAIQSASSASTSRTTTTKAKAKRRAEPEPEEKSTKVSSTPKKAQARKPLTRAQQRLQDEIEARAAKKIPKAPSTGSQTAVAVQPARRIAGTARVRALMGQHPYASAAGVAGVSAAAVAAATAAAAATGLVPPEQWALAVSAVQAGVATLQGWFA